jgi:hypothetical protein
LFVGLLLAVWPCWGGGAEETAWSLNGGGLRSAVGPYVVEDTFGQPSVIGYSSATSPAAQIAWGFRAAAVEAQPNAAPNQPTNLSPAAGVTTNTTVPVLKSSAFSDPDAGDTHAASQWQVRYTTGTYAAPLFDSTRTTTSLTNCAVPGGLLWPGQTYFWHIRHQDNHTSWNVWSAETSFTVSAFGWVQIGADGPARAAMGYAFEDGRNRGIIFGGDTPAILTDETWEWNGASVSWSQVATSGPGPHANPAMAYDASRGETVLHGGWVTPDNYYADTWVHTGAGWAFRTSSGPSARANQAMAYDSARHLMILFGGSYYGSFYGDTWQWDGATWAQSSSSGPSARIFSRMAYDAARNRIVLFGGQTGYPGTLLNDTWEWDGTSWVLRATGGPSPRAAHVMAYHPDRQRVTLFAGGGWGQAVAHNDTWEWDGTTWTQLLVSGPSARHFTAMFYDRQRGSLVLFGGYPQGASPSQALRDTWELRLGPAPNRAPNQPSNVSPAAGVTGVSLTPTLQSSAFSDPDTTTPHAASQWQIATANNFNTSPPLVWDSGRTTGSLTAMAVPAGLLQGNTTYYWRVRHQDNVGAWSAWSSPTWFATMAPPAAPTNLTATTISPSRINLSWTDKANNETGFRIERKTGPTGPWVEVAGESANATSYENTELREETTHSYRVRSFNAAGNSAYSNEASTRTYASNVRVVGQLGGAQYAVCLQGNYAYIGEGGFLRILDVSNPAFPVALGRLLLGDIVENISVNGNLAYVADGESGLKIVDVSNPSSPTLRASYDTPGVAEGISLSGGLAYVAADYSGLHIIDVSNPSSPSLCGLYHTPGWAQGVFVSGNLAYVADYTSPFSAASIFFESFFFSTQAQSIDLTGDFSGRGRVV